MFSTFVRSALLLVLVVALSACDKHSAVRKQYTASIAAAKEIPDPWKAYIALSAQMSFVDAKVECGRRWAGGGGCPALEEGSAVREELDRYLAQAASAGNPAALVVLFREKKLSDDQDALRAKLGTLLLAAADRATGATPAEVDLLYTAGSVVAEGQYVAMETDRAVGYFSKAWAHGEPQAADSAALVYQSINDVNNAYLWSLRCIGACRRGHGVGLLALQEKLAPEEAKRIQAAALRGPTEKSAASTP